MITEDKIQRVKKLVTRIDHLRTLLDELKKQSIKITLPFSAVHIDGIRYRENGDLYKLWLTAISEDFIECVRDDIEETKSEMESLLTK